LRPTSLFLRQNPIRFKKWGPAVIPHRKPRWVPMARSKMFVNPPTCLTPQEELMHEQELNVEYSRRMKALVKYLEEDYQKYSDTGEAGRIEAELDQKEHIKLVQENDAYNLKVAEHRKLRLEREREAMKERIAQEVLEAEQADRDRLEEAGLYVRRHAEQIKNRVQPDQLEAAILEALDNPVDSEFAIDIHGHIFKGRETRSLKVAANDREKLTPRETEEKFVLNAEN